MPEPIDPNPNDEQDAAPAGGSDNPDPSAEKAGDAQNSTGDQDAPAQPDPAGGDANPGGQADQDVPGGGQNASEGAQDATASGQDAAETGSPATPSDDGTLSQDEIDALQAQLEGGGSDAADKSQLSQDAVDGAFAEAGVDASGQPTAASQPAAQPTGGAVGQDDLDAVIAEAQDEAASEATQAEAQTQAAAAGQAATGSTAAPAGESAGGQPPAGERLEPVEMPDFSATPAANQARDISMLRDVDLHVHVELGKTVMFIEDVLKLSEGSVVELDNLAGDPVDVYVNGRLVARGEVLVLGESFCVRISEIVTEPQNVSVA